MFAHFEVCKIIFTNLFCSLTRMFTVTLTRVTRKANKRSREMEISSRVHIRECRIAEVTCRVSHVTIRLHECTCSVKVYSNSNVRTVYTRDGPSIMHKLAAYNGTKPSLVYDSPYARRYHRFRIILTSFYAPYTRSIAFIQYERPQSLFI